MANLDHSASPWSRCSTSGRLALSACILAVAGVVSPATAQGSTIHVSAAALARAPRFRLDSGVVTIIGGEAEAGGIDVGYSTYAAIRSDGHLLVFSPSDGLDVFDRSGKHLYHGGRQGQGPGEFAGGTLFVAGDTAVILDENNARISWWTWEARLIRSQSVAGRLAVSRRWHIAASLPGRHLILTNAGTWDNTFEGRPPARMLAAVIDLPFQGSAKPLFSLPDVALRGHALKTPHGVQSQTDYVRFGPRACVTQWGDRIVTGGGDQYKLDLRDSQGGVVSTVILDKQLRPLTRQGREQSIARETANLAQMRDIPDLNDKLEFVRTAPYADMLPAYEACLVSAVNELWLFDGHTPFDSDWTATGLKPDGTVVGVLTARTSDWPIQIAGDAMLMLHTDSDGVRSLVVRQMVRRSK